MKQKNGWLMKAMPLLLIVFGFLTLDMFQGYLALAFAIILHFFTIIDNQRVMKREPIFPQHFHNNFICWEGKGNKAPKMAS